MEAIKLEITNQNLVKALSKEADLRLIEPEQCIKQILQEALSKHLSPTSQVQAEQDEYSIATIKKQAEILGNNISNKLSEFSNKFNVTTSLEESDIKFLQSNSKMYSVKVQI